MIKDYFIYIKESIEEEKFKIGDKVIINGIVDDIIFDNQPDTIDNINILEDRVTTNMNKMGQCWLYTYIGLTYHMAEAQWWVSPYNLKKNNYKRVFSEEDPYGEEIWDNEVNEAKKVKGDEIFMNYHYTKDVVVSRLKSKTFNDSHASCFLGPIGRSSTDLLSTS